MTEPKRIPLIWLIVIAVALVWNTANGSDHDYDDDDAASPIDVSTSVATEIAGDSSRSFAVVSGLGNAAINNCVVTTQFGIPIIFVRQGFKEDKWCQAMALLRAGFRDTAILSFCRDTSIGDLYTTEQNCIDAMVQVFPEEGNPGKVEETRYVQQQEENRSLREELAAVTEQVAQQQQQQAIPPTRAVSANTAVLQRIQKRDAERVAEKEAAQAYFRKKYEASVAKETPDEAD